MAVRRRKKKNPVPKSGKPAKQHPTSQQWLFIHEYCKDFNGAGAALRAGYSEKSKGAIAHRLLHDPIIKREIDHVRKALTDAADVETGHILQEYKKIAFTSNLDFLKITPRGKVEIDWENISADMAAAIKGVEVDEDGKMKIVFHDKLRALEALGKYKKMFTDRVEIGGDIALGERLSRARERRAKKK